MGEAVSRAGGGNSRKLRGGGRTGPLYCIIVPSPPQPPSHSAPFHRGLRSPLGHDIALECPGIFPDGHSRTLGAGIHTGGLGPSLSDTDPQPTRSALCVELLSVFRGCLGEPCPSAPATPNSEVRGSQWWKKRHRQNTSVCPRSVRKPAASTGLGQRIDLLAQPRREGLSPHASRGAGRGKGSPVLFCLRRHTPWVLATFVWPPARSEAAARSQEVLGSLLAGPGCHCPGQILPASVLSRGAPMHSSVGQRGWLPPLPPRSQVQVQGLGFGRNRDKGGREDGGGGLTPGGTE